MEFPFNLADDIQSGRSTERVDLLSASARLLSDLRGCKSESYRGWQMDLRTDSWKRGADNSRTAPDFSVSSPEKAFATSAKDAVWTLAGLQAGPQVRRKRRHSEPPSRQDLPPSRGPKPAAILSFEFGPKTTARESRLRGIPQPAEDLRSLLQGRLPDLRHLLQCRRGHQLGHEHSQAEQRGLSPTPAILARPRQGMEPSPEREKDTESPVVLFSGGLYRGSPETHVHWSPTWDEFRVSPTSSGQQTGAGRHQTEASSQGAHQYCRASRRAGAQSACPYPTGGRRSAHGHGGQVRATLEEYEPVEQPDVCVKYALPQPVPHSYLTKLDIDSDFICKMMKNLS